MLLALAHAEEPAWDVNAEHGPSRAVQFTTTEGTWMGVDVSPDGQTLLFDLLGDLYTLPVAGGVATRLTVGAAWDTDAHWSPDGARIAYTSDRDGNEEIWVMNADGGSARRITREEKDRWTDPVWAPEPGWLLARRRSVDTRSIGVQELWMIHEEGGAGVQLTKLDVDPHAGEAAFSPDGRRVWFSTRSGRFEYNHDPHRGLWQIASYDRQSGERLVHTDLAGSASRPTPSPDGTLLAFLSREKTETVLQTLELATGRIRRIGPGLDPDQMEGFELRGTYPRMDFTPDGKAVVLWARGGFWRVDLASRQWTAIPMSAGVDLRVTEAVRPVRRVDEGAVHARMIRWPVQAPSGTVYAAAFGRIWAIEGEKARSISPEDVAAAFPTLSADGKQLAWTSWDDGDGGYVWAGPPGAARRITETPADVQAPAFGPDGRSLVWLRADSAAARGGDLGDASRYDLVLGSLSGGDGRRLRSIPFRGSAERAPRPQFSADGKRIFWLEDIPKEGRVPADSALRSCNLEGTDERTHLVVSGGAQEIRVSPDGRMVAWRHEHEGWVAPMPALDAAKIESSALPVRRLTEEAGDFLEWSAGRLSWSHGDQLFRVDPAGLVVREAKAIPVPEARSMKIELPRAVGAGTVALVNARILSMDEAGVIPRGSIVVRDRRILAVGADVLPPPGATVYDLGGKTVLPGLVDVHAHLHYSAGDVLPEQEWRHLANLAYGVTTVFDPSASTDLVFAQAELIEAGRMIGPRVYSTGYILYGALNNQGARIQSYADAERHVRRLLRVGAWGIKSYQQPRRTQRQWLVEAARKLGVLDVPEGGGDLFMNLGMVLDGHSSIEHSLPVAPLYADVRQLWAAADTTYVPTLLVAYGGVMGEVENYQAERVWEDARLARYTPPDVLLRRAYRLSPYITDRSEFHHHRVAQAAAQLARAGVRVALGAHGQLQGLGPHWELEALGLPGAMSPLEALRAATLGGAEHLGLDQDLGSLRPGKIADLFVVDGDPTTDLKAARNVVWVMKDGRMWDAASMDQLQPDPVARPKMMWESDQLRRRASGD